MKKRMKIHILLLQINEIKIMQCILNIRDQDFLMLTMIYIYREIDAYIIFFNLRMNV